MAQSFHLFLSLPPELRLRVWESAVVDRSIAGVNFFTFERQFRGDDPPSIVFLPMNCAPHCGWSCLQIAACSTWQHGMKSTSEEDSSLWVTCRDSRHVMKQMIKELNRHQNAPGSDAGLSSAGEQSRRTGDFPTASTGISTDNHGETRRFTFVPTRDLFVFCPGRFFNFGLESGLRLDIDCVLPGERSSLSCVEHFAFETDAHWPRKCDILHITSAFYRIALQRANAPIFYLIDYRLRRQERPTADRQTTAVFQAVRGRFFDAEEDYSWEYSFNDSSDRNNESMFDFVMYLRRIATDTTFYLDDWWGKVAEKSFRVLAYEPDGKDGVCEKNIRSRCQTFLTA